MPSSSRSCMAHPARIVGPVEGTVSILFTISLVVIVASVGLAIDYGRALTVRTALQSAMDSSVLAAGRDYQVNRDIARAKSQASDYFAAAMASHDGATITQNEINPQSMVMTLTAKAAVPTTFSRVLGYNQIELSSTAEAMLSAGGLDKNLEIALMLDTTGSMCSPCTKLSELKEAAKDLITIVVQDDQSKFKSRAALIPFSQAVNVGPYFDLATGKGGLGYSSCVVERPGLYAFDDEAPGLDAETLLGAFDIERAYSTTRGINQYTDCRPVAELVPLISDRAKLTAEIDQFHADGYTAGQIGTAWAWYALSPKWNDIWPSASQAADYEDDETMKIAVLMTDGEYNTAYRSENGDSAHQAEMLCQGMKQSGITVYTVGFMVGSSARDLLSGCASSPSHFFDATNGEELKLAFRQIAFRVAQLRLSK